jgi:hypothetical protein
VAGVASDSKPAHGRWDPWNTDWERRQIIARLLPLWPHELTDQSDAGRLGILAKLRRALRAERCRGVAGHWTYDLARHIELLRAYKTELAALRSRRGSAH